MGSGEILTRFTSYGDIEHVWRVTPTYRTNTQNIRSVSTHAKIGKSSLGASVRMSMMNWEHQLHRIQQEIETPADEVVESLGEETSALKR